MPTLSRWHQGVLPTSVNYACWSIAPTAQPPPKPRNYFAACRIQATFVHISPDGKNINEGCGALHPETLGKNGRGI